MPAIPPVSQDKRSDTSNSHTISPRLVGPPPPHPVRPPILARTNSSSTEYKGWDCTYDGLSLDCKDLDASNFGNDKVYPADNDALGLHFDKRSFSLLDGQLTTIALPLGPPIRTRSIRDISLKPECLFGDNVHLNIPRGFHSDRKRPYLTGIAKFDMNGTANDGRPMHVHGLTCPHKPTLFEGMLIGLSAFLLYFLLSSLAMMFVMLRLRQRRQRRERQKLYDAAQTAADADADVGDDVAAPTDQDRGKEHVDVVVDEDGRGNVEEAVISTDGVMDTTSASTPGVISTGVAHQAVGPLGCAGIVDLEKGGARIWDASSLPVPVQGGRAAIGAEFDLEECLVRGVTV